MSKQPVDHAALKIKRKRAQVWPFATRSLCEKVVKLPEEDEFVRELSPRRSGESNPRLRSVARASGTRGGVGSKTTLMLGTSPSSDNMRKTPPNLPEGPVLKGVSFQESIPHSPNYFDALLEMEEDPPLVERTPLRKDRAQGDLSPKQGPEQESPYAFGAAGEGSGGKCASTSPTPEPRGGSSDTPGRSEKDIENWRRQHSNPGAGLLDQLLILHMDRKPISLLLPQRFPRAYPGLGTQHLCPRIW